MRKILALLMAAVFVLGFLPTLAIGITGDPEFAMTINGEFSSVSAPIVFKGLKKSTTFEVEILAWQVTDLYAYEFKVEWVVPATGPVITITDHEVKSIHENDFVIKEKAFNPSKPYWGILNGYYHQAVTAISPSEGFSGTAAVANLFFHIEVNPQYPTNIPIELVFTVYKMSDSCGNDINPIAQSGFILLKAVAPIIKMLPPITINSVLGETFEVQLEIQNVVKMKSFHFLITWDDHQITTDEQNVWIKDFLPPPYESLSITFVDDNVNDVYDGVEVDVVMPCEKDPIDGTGELMGIRFTTLDPWGTVWTQDNTAAWPDPYALERPAIPPYDWVIEPKIDPYHKIWFPDKCWNEIFISGYIDKDDGTVYQDLCDYDSGVWIKPWYADYYDKLCYDWDYCETNAIGFYEFRPIPGDLNLDGHVDIEDLSAIAKVYGKTYGVTVRNGWPYYCDYPLDIDPTEWYFSFADDLFHYFADFDLNFDFTVDIFDVVIVAKNFCRTEPDALHPQPFPDP